MNRQRREASLRARVIGMFILVGFIAVVAVVGVGDAASERAETDLDRMLEQALAVHLAAPIDGTAEDGIELPPQLRAANGDTNDRTLAFETTDASGGTGERAGDPDAPRLDDVPNGSSTVDGWRVLVTPLPDGGRALVAADASRWESVDLRWPLAAASAAIWMSLGLALMWLSRSVLRPLRTLGAVTEAVAAGDDGVRVNSDALVPEVALVGDGINRMLDTQQASFAAEREARLAVRDFVADAGHELRTPLTAISGWARLLSSDRLDDERRQLGLDRIRSETDRLAAIVEDLLVLTRADQGREPLDGSCDPAAVLAGHVEDHEMLDPSRAVTVAAAGEVVIAMPADAFGQIVSNLLANLRSHTPAGTAASITIDSDGSGTRVVYRDDGPGVADPGSIFDRFWQEDPARSGRGSGLGMSVVAALAEAADGTAEAAVAPGGGLEITVTVPNPEHSGDLQEISSEV